MSTEFASAGLTAGQLNAIVKKLGGHDMALHFLRDKLSTYEPTRSWRNEDGVIYFSVTSDGTTGEDWIKRLEGNGFRVWDGAKQVLRSPYFKSTSRVVTEVAVLKSVLFEGNRLTKKIRATADKRKLSKPNAEVACLIREKFTDEEIEQMGLYFIITMHEPINNLGGHPQLLGASRVGVGCSFGSYEGGPRVGWDHPFGFAFAVSQVGSHSTLGS